MSASQIFINKNTVIDFNFNALLGLQFQYSDVIIFYILVHPKLI